MNEKANHLQKAWRSTAKKINSIKKRWGDSRLLHSTVPYDGNSNITQRFTSVIWKWVDISFACGRVTWQCKHCCYTVAKNLHLTVCFLRKHFLLLWTSLMFSESHSGCFIKFNSRLLQTECRKVSHDRTAHKPLWA